jgi:hypothetical protein
MNMNRIALMIRVHGRVATLVALGAFLAASAGASTPVLWETATLNGLARGDVESLSIDAAGRLSLGPAADLAYETPAPFLWSMVEAPDGSLYVGSGNEGKVFRIQPDGKGSVFFDANELEVHALALAPDGGLYVGTSPDGQIYKVDGKGAARLFFDPNEKYIWSLAVDRSGNVYAGTGDKGQIYKIAPDGNGKVFYQTKSTNAISLALDRDGNLLAGTESPGRLFRIDGTGKAFLLLDSPYQEVSAIHLDPKGTIYVSAVNGRATTEARPGAAQPTEPAPAANREPIPVVTTEVTSISIVDVGAGSPPQEDVATREDRRTSRGAIYRVKPDGLWDLLWESREELPYDLTFDADGAVLVGTGRGGKLLRLAGDPVTPTLVLRAVAEQVTGFARGAKGAIFYATSNPGKIFRLSPARADQGTYTSEVRDAKTVAVWGTLSWHASLPPGAGVAIYTRSGNTGTPDETWSAWAGPYQRPAGEQIASPNARYLQWKAVLTAKQASPVLTSVVAGYLQRNTRPKVTSITVHPAGTVFQKPYSTGELEIAGYDGRLPDGRTLPVASASSSGGGAGISAAGPPLGRRVYQKGLQTVVWRAADEDGDELRFDILYRREGEAEWKALRKDISDTIFVWDTTSVPDGTYTVQIVASDARSNPAGTALQGTLESTAFEIDNTPPVITLTGSRRDGGKTVLLFQVTDEGSPVQRVEYSQNAESWSTVYPKDGIFDSRLEDFELNLDPEVLARGVIIRAADAKNNIATRRADATASQGR